MTSALLPLTFSIGHASTLDTLEAILAIARRGGLTLATLELQPSGRDAQVQMNLLAHDPHLLDLFEARLRNVIGVHDIERRSRGAGSLDSGAHRPACHCRDGGVAMT